MAAAAEARPRTARPTTAPPRVEWQTPKTAVVIPRLLSKQSRRVTGSEPASRSMRSVEYNILAPPPPSGDMTPRTSLGRVAHKARSDEASFTSSLASARGRSKSDFMRSSVPLDHVTENKAPAPASGSSTARTMGESSSLASFRSGGGDISSPRGGKRIVVREERRPRPQTSKAMVANTHASRSHLGTTSGLAGAPLPEPSSSSSSSNGHGHGHGGRGMAHSRSQVMTAAPERRGLAAGAGRTHDAFASSSVNYNILSPPSTGPIGPKPSQTYAFIASQHGTHAAGGGSKK